ncbi:MAG: hypothetical protein M1814_003210 [Vezdaea aestivalis]|nr:MAG: hypothetical protein M1814_003210 [Vezdaea aestivalis]
MFSASSDESTLVQKEISELNQRLKAARARLKVINGEGNATRNIQPQHIVETPKLHSLLLLTDSALPLGTFAFSSALESFLAHKRSPSTGPGSPSPLQLFKSTFLPLSLSAIASTTLPYLLAAHTRPGLLPVLDDELDASTACTVARRASIAQGTALLAVWVRAFAVQYQGHDSAIALAQQVAALRAVPVEPAGKRSPDTEAHGHFAPLFGAVSKAMGVDAREAAFAYLFSHVRAVVSAAVRASVLGPYQAQGVLSGGELRDKIEIVIDKWWDIGVGVENKRWREAGQTAPMIDIWGGRHELLYSRIFNS